MKRKIEDKLKQWKENIQRKPLLLYGARQVGKTYIINKFGQENFENVIYINLETNSSIAKYFQEDITPSRLIKFLELMYNQEILPEKTLIFFDEIQSCERALTSLKYFCEMAPQYPIIAAGSLLGVAINREKYSFPVGKIESLTLFPMDFEEFLWALGEGKLAHEIRESYKQLTPMPEPIHKKAIEYYRYYLIVGGMPVCIEEFVKTQKLISVQNLQGEILNNYIADMSKYATASDTVKIRGCFNSIPTQLAKENKKFQYKVVQRGGSATIFGESIDWLAQSAIVQKCNKITQGENPIAAYMDLSSFKIYMGDVGLLVMKSALPQHTILTGEANIFMGSVTENYVIQSLAANGHNPYYWASEHSAELDFVIQKETDIIGIEVKKGVKTHSKSLNTFMQKYKPNYAIKLSEKNFGKVDNIISVPFYAAFCI